MKIPQAFIYTDGSVDKKKFGGWAYVVVDHKGVVHSTKYGGTNKTTNNKMELQAVLMALHYIPNIVPITIYSDSKYVVKGAEDWVWLWMSNGWKTADGEDVKNKEYWKEYISLIGLRDITVEWVPGHKGVKHNELADKLANKGRLEAASWIK